MNKIKAPALKRLAALAAVCAAAVSLICALPAAAANYAPVAENLEFTTYRGVPVAGVFSAVDAEGDMLTFSVVKQPRKGTVDTNGEGGFIYTPDEGKKGRDVFSYVASDSAGNVSKEATVTVEIKKQSTSVTYSDMDSHRALYAALYLAENGIFTGQKLGNEYFFCPDEAVSRGEFLAMCLNAAGIDGMHGISRTGFWDDADIPVWVKPYVASALVSGIVSGYENEEGNIVFSAQDPITLAQAAVVINEVLDLTDVHTSVTSTDSCPAWAYQAAVNLAACDIIGTAADDGIYTETLTRADAAELLMNAMHHLEARGTGGLLGWAK